MRALTAIAALLLSAAAHAHPLAPALLQLQETAPDTYDVLWRTSMTRARSGDVSPALPAACRETRAASVTLPEPDALVARWSVRCAGGLAGRELSVAGLERSSINVIVRVETADGTWTQLLDAREPRWSVPAREPAAGVFTGYLGLGVEHLLRGFDHVLFVAGLVLLVRRARPLVLSVTAFTLGHSVTLALATLGLVQVDSGLMELGIALSILVLAVELARSRDAPPSLLARRPAAMAAAFGLLHGLGFASALAETGLPAGEIPLALLAFNLGIEIGQLAVVATLLAARAALRRLTLPATRWAALAPAYVLGALAAFWALERAVEWMQPA